MKAINQSIILLTHKRSYQTHESESKWVVYKWNLSNSFEVLSIFINNNTAERFNTVPHDDVIKWKHFPRYWTFVRRIHRSPVNFPHKGQWRGALMFSLICARINGWVNTGDLRRHRAHYDVIVIISTSSPDFNGRPFPNNILSYSNVFPCAYGCISIQIALHWFLMVQLTITHNYFNKWLDRGKVHWRAYA